MLEIRKTGNKNFTHISEPYKPYIASDLTIIFDGNIGFLRSVSGRIIFERNGWNYTQIRIYDETNGGAEESFPTTSALVQRLINLGYPAYYTDGEIIITNLISNDAGNSLTIGSDGLLFASASGGASVDSVNGETGTVVLDADDINDTSTVNKFATQLQLSQIASNLAEIEQNTDAISDLEAEQSTQNTNITNLGNNKANKPISTTDTGTTISLENVIGNFCNMSSANTNTTFNLSNIVTGGQAVVLINTATEPTITGATKIKGSDFIISTDMHMVVQYFGTTVQYYFLEL